MASRSLYFAYGSNLSFEQMRQRCPGFHLVGRAILPNHELVFVGHSPGWGGAVASVVRRLGSQVQGLLYELPRHQLLVLDRHEGHPAVYRREHRKVLNEFGNWRRAFVYVRELRDPNLPGLPYLRVLVREYQRQRFDLGPLAVAATGGE